MSELRAHLSPNAVKNIETWLSEPKYAEYKAELETMIANEQWQVLEDAFFKVIEFGTGGRRGATGVGSNRINRVTIGESTQALCLYAQKANPAAAQNGIVIACDTRISSPELSQYAACVAAANGFKTYIFEHFRATPELSFAVRELDAAVGIVISASHNPPQDNGFKAYWNDGGQLVSPHDKGVLTIADELSEIHAEADFDTAVKAGKITILGADIDEKYWAAVLDQSENDVRDLSIVYSPLHGAGQTNTLPVLKKAGFSVTPEPDQMIPDGHFPTIENGKPNPEEKAANDRAVALMLADRTDIAITNDPDADRIGIVVRQDDEPVYLTGNQAAVLATDFTLAKLTQKDGLTPKHYIAKTIVTTDMMQAVGDHYGVKTYGDLLVGFKYIGELIREKEAEDEIFVIGGEESYGLLKGDYARDKDGAVGALSLAEYATELKKNHKTLWDRMCELYALHGLYVERLDNLQCPGADGFKRMQAIMQSLRDNPPLEVDGETITAVLDYQTRQKCTVGTGELEPMACIAGNVLVYEFGDSRCRITIRPSGTEPKIKFYTQWWRTTQNVQADYKELQHRLGNLSRVLEGIALERQ